MTVRIVAACERWACLALTTLALACQGEVGGGTGPSGAGTGDPSGKGTGTPGSAGGSSPGGVVTGPNGCRAADPGNVVIRRLNRLEYNNTVRDLFDNTTRPATAFPPDSALYGYDTVGEALSLSPVLMEGYITAAEQVVSLAMANATSRSKIVSCDPVATGEQKCAEQILSRLGTKVFRRPIEATELNQLYSIVVQTKNGGLTFSDGIAQALQAMLVSPSFLFRYEIDPTLTSTASHTLGAYEVATRLSYFVWSSTPDDTLLAAAASGELLSTAGVEKQVRRLLADPRAQSLLESFADQWLNTGDLESTQRDAKKFPSFTEGVRRSMKGETAAFFSSFLTEDKPGSDMIQASYAYLNDELAAHYGLSKVGSTQIKKVDLKGARVGGFLGQGSVLTVTSEVSNTNPVKRGLYVLDRFMCSKPPPPPPGAKDKMPPAGVALSVRQRLAAHRQEARCAGCHDVMDPIGLGIDNFSPVGTWRTQDDRGFPIDASGMLPTGETFQGPAELAGLLKKDPRFPACITKNLATFAVGRGLTSADDACALGALAAQNEAAGMRLKELVVLVAKSDLFRARRAEGATP